jgi:hypothetical protein
MGKLVLGVIIEGKRLIVQTDLDGLDSADISTLCMRLDIIRGRLLKKWNLKNGGAEE